MSDADRPDTSDALPLQPRRGVAGVVDRLLGPGASATEQLRVAVATGAGALLGALTVDAGLAATLVLAILSAEISGGLVAQLNASGKRWQHRPGRLWWHHLLFVAAHGVHLALFFWLFRAGNWSGLALAWLSLMAGAAAVLLSPPRLQRGIALGALLVALLVLQRLLPVIREAAWFMPLLFAKLLVAYLPAPLPPGSRDP